MKKFVAMMLAACSVFTLAACKNNSASGKIGDTYVLTIYRARDAGMTDGARDGAVKQAIEEKFYNDTGISISLDVQLYTNTDLGDTVDVNFNNKNKNIDGIIHYLSEDSGSAITKYAKDADATMDLDPVLAEYGQNILSNIQKNDTNHLADRSGYFNYDGKYYRTALTSFAKEGGFGILMRKDLMADVMDETGLNPEDYDITNANHKNMTVSQFESVMKAIKSDTDNGVTTPVNGAPWDLARVVATAYGVDGMSAYGVDKDGKYVPSQFTENWSKYVDLMYDWAKDGVWEKESNTTTDDQRQTNFIAGTCAAYCAYPTAEQLISLSKKFYAANSEAELMVIAPFASEDASGNVLTENGEPVVNGNLKTARGFYGMVVPYRSANYEILIQYIDWMYSSAENYELCQYGVKGVDWVEGEDFVHNGTTYKTWAYPDDKAEEYLAKSPYAGIYMLLPNVNVSNRICAHYSSTEKTWYTSLYFGQPLFGSVETEGVWLPETPRSLASQETKVSGEYIDNIRSRAWVGMTKDGKTPTEMLSQYVVDMRSSCGDYLNHIDSSFKSAMEYFNGKYNK